MQNPVFCFIILSLGIYYLIGLFDYVLRGPQALHFIRQTDSLAFFMGYFQYGNSFFEPRVYEVTGQAGKAAAEFPIIYYLGSWIAKIVGPDPAILRILDLSVFSLGILALFRLSFGLLQRFTLAFCATWLGFASVVMMFYASGFVPDAPGLGLVLMFWYWIYRNSIRYKMIHWFWAVVCLTLAGLIKPTMLIYGLALPGVIVLFINRREFIGGQPMVKWLMAALACNAVAFGLTFWWVGYAHAYNEANGNSYFLSESRPIWDMTREEVHSTIQMMTEYWYPNYMYVNLWWFWILVGCLAVLGLFVTRGLFRGLFVPVFLGCLGVLLLFFRQFHDHDYYFIIFYPLFYFTLLSVLLQLRHHYPRIFRSPALALGLVVLLTMAFENADRGLDDRYAHTSGFSKAYLQLQGYDQVMDSLQISDSSAFGVVGGLTPNASFLAIQRPGYNVRDTSDGELNRIIGLHKYRHLSYILVLNGWDLPQNFRDQLSLSPVFDRDSIKCYRIRR